MYLDFPQKGQKIAKLLADAVLFPVILPSKLD
jgi:hypothetical protein